jgi:hypothetical protein
MERHFMKDYLYLRQSIISVTLLYASGTVFAQSKEEFLVIPYVDVGISDLQLDTSGSFADRDIPLGFDTNFNFRSTMFRAGVAMSWGKLYGNVYYRFNSESSDSQILPDGAITRWALEREESSAAIGYRLTPEVSVFAGYRSSEVDATAQPSGSFLFEDDGFFLGSSYQLNLTDSGSLTFSLGYALLDTDFEESVPVFGVPFELEATGDGEGIKFAVGWRDFFNNHWGYSVGVEYFDYEYDLEGEVVNFDIEESDATMSLGLFYVF